jgi:hypothetical protein
MRIGLQNADYLQTDYLNAVYGTSKDGQIVSVYEPTHVLNGGTSGSDVQDEINNFSLFTKDPDANAKNYGYQSDKAYKAAQHTKCWWIWDKTTRRVFLYAENKWEWPLWVWDDPLKLVEFFPYPHLWFHETPEGSQPKGEVTYYLDQQDALMILTQKSHVCVVGLRTTSSLIRTRSVKMMLKKF